MTNKTKPDYKKLESVSGKYVRIMLPLDQIKKLGWQGGEYVKIYSTDTQMIIERIKN